MAKKRTVRKLIITAAITGAAHTPTMSDYLPTTPQQIVDDAVKAYEAGASIAHVHARNPETGQPTADLNVFGEILSGIKSRCDMVVCVTTGGAGDVEQRVAVVSRFKPELATLNLGSLSRTMTPVWDRMKDRPFKHEWEKVFLQREEMIFTNTYRMMREYAKIMRDNGTKPELEIWDVGHISNAEFLLQQGFIQRPLHLQFVMGGLGGIPANAKTLVYVMEEATRVLGEFTWLVAASGRFQIPMSTAALLLGGHARVGLEDSLFAGYGKMATCSADQVEKVVKIAAELDIEPATPEETRKLIGLKGNDKVNF